MHLNQTGLDPMDAGMLSDVSESQFEMNRSSIRFSRDPGSIVNSRSHLQSEKHFLHSNSTVAGIDISENKGHKENAPSQIRLYSESGSNAAVAINLAEQKESLQRALITKPTSGNCHSPNIEESNSLRCRSGSHDQQQNADSHPQLRPLKLDCSQTPNRKSIQRMRGL
jgi:hypothetical protein